MSNKSSGLNVEDVFAVNENVRWVGLVSARGDVMLNKMRPGLKSSSPQEFDEEFLKLGLMTMLGVAERYSPYRQELEAVVVWHELTVLIYSRLGSQVVAISVENHQGTISVVRSWLKKKKAELKN